LTLGVSRVTGRSILLLEAAQTQGAAGDTSSLEVQCYHAAKGWMTLARVASRPKWSPIAFDSLPGDSIRIISAGGCLIRYAGVVSGSEATPISLKLASAVHNHLGDVRGSLEGAGSSVILAPSDTLEVAFKAPPQGGARTDYFVKVTGGWTVSSTKGLNSLAETVERPRVFALHSARPNPSRASTLIRFDVPRAERVAIEVFDLQGRKIRTLVRGWQPAGAHEVSWNRVTDSGARAAPGVYLYRMVASTYHSQRKLVLLP
jgi:hypothetical protein